MKTLFILKKRTNHHEWVDYSGTYSSGLLNSVKFVNEMLNQFTEIESKYVEVVDNNCIDKEVSSFKPDIVIIEALWVVPEKFKVLSKLHPKVKWVIRLHSEVPFIANEGSATDWLHQYAELNNVYIAANSYRMKTTLDHILDTEVLYLPNYYPLSSYIPKRRINKKSEFIDISCFGAIRPMKNHLMQAMAAIKFANDNEKILRFHVNTTRKEQKGDSVYKNLNKLFYHSYHELVEVDWLPHDRFLNYISNYIDIGMQVSYSETYNIVAADHVECGIPVVASPEIDFIYFRHICDPNSLKSIVKGLNLAYDSLVYNYVNTWLLASKNTEAKNSWWRALNDYV